MKNLFFILLFLLSANGNLLADNDKYVQITNATGLSNSAINCISQDSTQMLWFGTWDGLNTFNGKDITVYKPEPDKKGAISNNIIRKIVEQRKGIIWIVTDHGINRMDLRSASFSSFYFGYENHYPALPEIYSLAKSSENIIFCAVFEWGLSFYDEKDNKFQSINTPFVNIQDIKNITIDYNDHIWILHENGQIDVLEWEKDDTGSIIISRCTKTNLPPVKQIYAKNNYIIALDQAKKVSLFDTRNSENFFEYDLKKIIPYGDILELDIIDEKLYVAPSTGSFYSLPLDHSPEWTFNKELQGIRVISFFKCRQNILWIGTDGDGVYMFYNKNKPFNTTRLKKEMNIVRSFCEDDQHRLWVATKGGGIAVLKNHYTNSYKLVDEYNTGNGLPNNSVYVIEKSFDSDLFIGTDGKGIQVFSNGVLSTLESSSSIDFMHTYAIHCSEKDSALWIGTSGYGLVKINILKTKTGYKAIGFKQYLHNQKKTNSLSNNVIYSIIPDKHPYLWIGTRGGGLNRFNTETEEFTTFYHNAENTESISSNDVLCLYKDSDGDLWIGTSAGLNHLKNRTDQVFIKYGRENGLPNNTVHGILEDNNRNIWISTNKGIARIDHKTGQVTSYYERNGLQNNEFSDGAYYKSESDNELFFGGIAGFNIFDPNKISLSDYIPDFYISSFKIFNKEQNIHDRIVTNEKGRNELKLNYNENFFSFNFLALDYIQNDNCEYKFKLEGVDKDYIHNENQGNLTYTNISPGKYTLIIYYTNSDKVWVEKPYTLDIVIKEPYWHTTTAYLIYFLITCGIIYLIFIIIKKRLSQEKNLLIERLSRKEQENIHEAKLRFFTNIAHELYTPITLIYSPCEKILEEKDINEFVRKYVKIIKSNAERMKQLISELMLFRKITTEHAVVTPKLIHIAELVNEVSCNFSEIIEENKIDFTINMPDSAIQWISDRDSVEKILFNIISNAFKYTPQGGYIRIDISSDTENLYFDVSNSGKGISPNDREKIFNRFNILEDFENQIEKGKSGRNGIGLALTKSLVDLLKGSIKVESEIGHSTTFKITLPGLEDTDSPEDDSKPDINAHPKSIPVSGVKQLPSGENGSPMIMVIDDEKEIRQLLADILSEKYSNIN
jgi:signal transduction histidine kinase/ligand-binding sensor domain-containing protein